MTVDFCLNFPTVSALGLGLNPGPGRLWCSVRKCLWSVSAVLRESYLTGQCLAGGSAGGQEAVES